MCDVAVGVLFGMWPKNAYRLDAMCNYYISGGGINVSWGFTKMVVFLLFLFVCYRLVQVCDMRMIWPSTPEFNTVIWAFL